MSLLHTVRALRGRKRLPAPVNSHAASPAPTASGSLSVISHPAKDPRTGENEYSAVRHQFVPSSITTSREEKLLEPKIMYEILNCHPILCSVLWIKVMSECNELDLCFVRLMPYTYCAPLTLAEAWPRAHINSNLMKIR